MKKSSQSPNRSNKRLKLSSGTDSDRIITLTQKRVKARLFEETNFRNKEALNKLKSNDDFPEEKIFSNHSGSEASDTLFIDTKVSKKEKRKERKPRYTTRGYFWESEICHDYLRKCMFLWPFLPPEFFNLTIGSFQVREDTRRW